MANGQLERAGKAFEIDLARDLEDPFARIYALELAKINAIEAARKDRHLSKVEIGQRIDRKPSVDLELEAKVKKTPSGASRPSDCR